MGYGASGAGKTSSLIYLNKDEGQSENGILVHLCNLMGKSNFKNIKIEFNEFYNSDFEKTKAYEKLSDTERQEHTSENRKDKTFIGKDFCGKDPIHNNKDIIFTFDTANEFQLTEDYTHTINHPSRVKQLDSSQANPEETHKFNRGAKLGEVLIYIIDKDRHVKATPNNINSSRSHSLIFVTFSKNNDFENTPNDI